jgi:[ribosomal protein S5]-alanine N-acetyltransferase
MLIESERLKIQPVTIADASFILSLLTSESWIKYIGKRDVATVEDAENYIRDRFLAHYEQHGFGIYMVFSQKTNEPMGIITLLRKPHLDSPDIGYAFLDTFNGNGFAFEATKKVYEYAQKELAMTRIVAVVLENNGRSIKLLEKLGFHFEQKIQQGDEELLLFVNQ